MTEYKCLNKCCTLVRGPYCYSKKSRKFSPKSGVFIYDPKTTKILLVQSRGNLWGPAKGTMKKGESFKECAIREVHEETGLLLDSSQLTFSLLLRGAIMYYYLELDSDTTTVSIQNFSGNDANGIGWIKIDCLKTMIQNKLINISSHCSFLCHRFLNAK